MIKKKTSPPPPPLPLPLPALSPPGRLYINGKKVTSDRLSKSSAYVQQEDLFIGTFTVREQLMFQVSPPPPPPPPFIIIRQLRMKYNLI